MSEIEMYLFIMINLAALISYLIGYFIGKRRKRNEEKRLLQNEDGLSE